MKKVIVALVMMGSAFSVNAANRDHPFYMTESGLERLCSTEQAEMDQFRHDKEVLRVREKEAKRLLSQRPNTNANRVSEFNLEKVYRNRNHNAYDYCKFTYFKLAKLKTIPEASLTGYCNEAMSWLQEYIDMRKDDYEYKEVLTILHDESDRIIDNAPSIAEGQFTLYTMRNLIDRVYYKRAKVKYETLVQEARHECMTGQKK